MIKIFNSKLNDVVMNTIPTSFFMIIYLLDRYICKKENYSSQYIARFYRGKYINIYIGYILNSCFIHASFKGISILIIKLNTL